MEPPVVKKNVKKRFTTRDFKCTLCPKTFFRNEHLQKHTLVHSGEKPHVCKVCGKAFNRNHSLRSHMYIHTDEKPFHCSFCDYACRDSSTLRKHQYNLHMGLVKMYQCTKCEKAFRVKSSLKAHVAEIHLHVDLRRHECPNCGKLFKSASLRNQHVRKVHTLSVQSSCPVCDKVISNKHNLRSHLMIHSDLRPYKCTVDGCDRRFKHVSSLRKHSFTHVTVKPHTCITCGRGFAFPRQLKSHIETVHNKRKRVECDYCGVRFYSKNYLIKHIKQKHAKKRKKFICDLCGFKTYNKPSIVMHIKHGHVSEMDRECHICHTIYKRNVYLKLHYIKTHNIRFKTKKRVIPQPPIKIKEEPLDDDVQSIDLFEIEKQEPVEESNPDQEVILEDELKDLLTHNKIREVPDFLFENFCNSNLRMPNVDVPKKRSKYEENTDKMEEQECKDIFRKVIDEINKKDLKKRIEERARNTVLIGRDEAESIIKVKMFKNKKTRSFSKLTPKLKNNKNNTKQNQSLSKADDTSINKDEEEMPSLYYDDSDDITSTVKDISSKCDTSPILSKTLTKDVNGSKKYDMIVSVTDDNILDRDQNDDNKNTDIDKNDDVERQNKTQPNLEVNEKPDPLKIEDNSDNIGDKTKKKSVAKNKKQKEINSKKNTKTYTDNNNTQVDEIDEKTNINDLEEKPINTYTYTQSRRPRLVKLGFDLKKILNDAPSDGNPENDYINTDDPKPRKIRKKHDKTKVKDKKTRPKKVKLKDDIKCKKVRVKKQKSSRGDVNSDEKPVSRKMNFNSHQCYICFKLYPTKQELLDHCRDHFDICGENILKKCPLCPYVDRLNFTRHLKKKHNVTIKINYSRIQDKQDNNSGSRYYYEITDNNAGIDKVEIIPSINNLNKIASCKIDKKFKENKNKMVAKSKLVRKGKEWVVESEKIDYSKDYLIPKDDEVFKSFGVQVKEDDSYCDKLNKLNKAVKKLGKKMLFPCQHCDKMCQGLSALKLHNRKHEDNPKPFAPKVYKHKMTDAPKAVEKTINTEHRIAKPQPIKNNHNCDPELLEFYRNNIRGGDIEFWQFLKIFNKMGRDKINDFNDLEGRLEYGLGHELDKPDDIKLDKDDNDTTVTKNDIEKNNKEKMPKANNNLMKKLVMKKPINNVRKRILRLSKKLLMKRNLEKQKLRERIASRKICST